MCNFGARAISGVPGPRLLTSTWIIKVDVSADRMFLNIGIV